MNRKQKIKILQECMEIMQAECYITQQDMWACESLYEIGRFDWAKDGLLAFIDKAEQEFKDFCIEDKANDPDGFSPEFWESFKEGRYAEFNELRDKLYQIPDGRQDPRKVA